ncbi:hypothetical protein QQX98_004722 [Neonectria punicea]|uniref:HNH nuclease domain-containing protein n=1 Tax=Neonectria punicea TaxID=979145 RepID=A0ABR1H8R6_9HYPO
MLLRKAAKDPPGFQLTYQASYTFLRLERFFIQPDILDHADLYYSSPSGHNSRCTDLGRRKTRSSRLGVYLRWTIPRPYRYGTTAKSSPKQPATEPLSSSSTAAAETEPGKETPILDSSAPSFSIPPVQAWVVESDRKFLLDDLGEDVDLQVDVSPFVDASERAEVVIDDQAEVSIGSKTDATPTSCDNFEYEEGQYLDKAKASYYVIGWHAKANADLLYQDTSPGNASTRSKVFDAHNMNMVPSSLIPTLSKWLGKEDSTRLICHGTMYEVNWDRKNLPKHVPANDCCKFLMDKPPIAVGMTPMDAPLAYVHAHMDFDLDPLRDLESSLDEIQKLLQARDDSVESQREAAELLMTWNYDHSEGGKRFHLSGGDGGVPADSKSMEPTGTRRRL